jgi:hypothetical protein
MFTRMSKEQAKKKKDYLHIENDWKEKKLQRQFFPMSGYEYFCNQFSIMKNTESNKLEI